MWQKVLLACSFGGFVGAFIALQIWPPLWWVGLVAGGLVVHITYEFKEVINAVPRAWRSACYGLQIGWRPGLWVLTGLAAMASNFLPFAWFVLRKTGKTSNAEQMAAVLSLLLPFFLIFGIVIYLAEKGGERGRRLLGTEDPMRAVVIWFNPISLVGYWLPFLSWFYGKRTLRATGLAAKLGITFFGHLFLLIHSKLRLLCALDAALGAAIGYFAGNALIGALAGGLIGVLNFEIVSKRLLGLAPSR